MVISVIVAVTLLTLLAVVIWREGPDRTVIGRVVSVEPHRICVASSADRAPQCVHVDAPQEVAGVSPGDCVRVRYSAPSLLAHLQPDHTCR